MEKRFSRIVTRLKNVLLWCKKHYLRGLDIVFVTLCLAFGVNAYQHQMSKIQDCTCAGSNVAVGNFVMCFVPAAMLALLYLVFTNKPTIIRNEHKVKDSLLFACFIFLILGLSFLLAILTSD